MIIYIIKAKSGGGITTHVNQLRKGLNTIGHHVEIHELSFSPLGILKEIYALRREVRKQRPDIIHYHGYRALLYRFVIPKGYHSLCTIHGFLEIKSVASKILKKILLFVTPKVDYYICVSHSLKKYFSKEFKIPKNKICVIHNGVNIPALTVQRSMKPTIIGACGRFVDIKGYHLLIKAFNKLRKDYHIQLHLIGDGPQLQNLKNLAQEGVYFHGYQKDVIDYIRFFHIFVQPSLLEGCGVSVLEAMSLNLPIVISDAGGLPELVIDNEDGLVFKKGDVDDLVNKLEMIITNTELYNVLGIKNKEKVSRNFSYKKMLEHTVNTYNCLMGDEVDEQVI